MLVSRSGKQLIYFFSSVQSESGTSFERGDLTVSRIWQLVIKKKHPHHFHHALQSFHFEVMGIALQGQRMVIALGVQDFVDRKASQTVESNNSWLMLSYNILRGCRWLMVLYTFVSALGSLYSVVLMDVADCLYAANGHVEFCVLHGLSKLLRRILRMWASRRDTQALESHQLVM